MPTEPPQPPDKDPLRQWHRVFGIALMEVFAGAPWRVELEQELSLTSQELDVAIIETIAADGQARLPDPLPDGLENLRAINLLSYKSRHESLDAWSLDELIGYYVLYRKVKLNARNARHPLGAFGLYAVATRYPRALAKAHAHALQATAWDGVYDLRWGSHWMRIIVLNQITPHPRNAAWELFASEQDRMRQGLRHYRAHYPHPRDNGRWALLEHLHRLYQREGPDMAYTMEQFLRETHEMVIDEAIRRDPEAILRRFDPEDVLKRYDPEQRLQGLDPEQRLQGLDPATIKAWLAKQRQDH